MVGIRRESNWKFWVLLALAIKTGLKPSYSGIVLVYCARFDSSNDPSHNIPTDVVSNLNLKRVDLR